MQPAMRCGVNIAYWLSQSRMSTAQRVHRPAFFSATDVQRIAEWGMDHVRLPVDQQVLWDAGGEKIPHRWDMLDVAVGSLISAGLTVVLDLHTLISNDVLAGPEKATLFDDPAAEGNFAACWAELSAFFKDRPVDSVVYELLNEPMAPTDADWNRVYRPVFDQIRQLEPDRWIVLGSNWYQLPDRMAQLETPDDSRTILSFHYYYPHALTHYGAAWSQGLPGYEGPVQYPGPVIPPEAATDLDESTRQELDQRGAFEAFDAGKLAEQIQAPLAVSKRTGLALRCGELGCLATVPSESRMRWYADVLDMLEANDIGWCIWNYKSTDKFGLVDDENQLTDVGKLVTDRLAR